MKTDIWKVDENAAVAEHEESGIKISTKTGDVLHVQTEPDAYGLDIPMWLIDALVRKTREARRIETH